MTVLDPTGAAFRAVFIRAHLRMLAAGMKNSQISGEEILARATGLTKKKYRRREYQTAIRDLTEIIEGAKR